MTFEELKDMAERAEGESGIYRAHCTQRAAILARVLLAALEMRAQIDECLGTDMAVAAALADFDRKVQDLEVYQP